MRTCPTCKVRWPSNLEYCLRDGTPLPKEPDAPEDWLDLPDPEEAQPRGPSPHQVGDELRGYTLEEQLGDGAMGVVWRARHTHLRHKVAIKVLHPDLCTDAEVIRRFFREAQVVNALNNPHIVSIIDFVDEADQAPFIVMEFLDGVELNTLLDPEHPMPLRQALEIARQIADALATVHAKHMVHRDLKPENIFVGGASDALEIKIVDFGLAKFQLDTHALLRTYTGSIVGTPMYMAPEQIRGEHVDHRCDIYAMGCILYALLTGDPPFVDEQVGELLNSHLHEAPTPPTHRVDEDRAREIPPVVTRATLRCLAKDPENRMQSMQELATLLGDMLDTDSEAPGDEPQDADANADAPGDESGPAQGANLRQSKPTPVPTLGESTDVVHRSRGTKGSRRGLKLAILGLGLLLCGVLVVLLWQRRASRQRAARVPKAAVQVPPSSGPHRTAPATAERRIRVFSVPEGAALVNPRTGQILWRTPALVTLPRHRARQLSVELPGHQRLFITLTPATKGPLEVHLRKSTTAHPMPPRVHPRPMRPRPTPEYPMNDQDTLDPFRR